MCNPTKFQINEDIVLWINKDCSVTMSASSVDDELEGIDWDTIELSLESARKVARILTEELG